MNSAKTTFLNAAVPCEEIDAIMGKEYTTAASRCSDVFTPENQAKSQNLGQRAGLFIKKSNYLGKAIKN